LNAVPDWLDRLRGLVRASGSGGSDRAADTDQSRRVETALVDRSLFSSDVARLDAALVAIGDGPPDPRTLDHLMAAFKTIGLSAPPDMTDPEASAHLAFWKELAGRDPADPVLQAHLAEAEMTLGEPADGVRRFLDVFDARPELFSEFGWDLEDDARALGGELMFRWQIHHLRWFLHAAGEHTEGGDDAREIYGSLLDEYRDDEARLAIVQRFGEELQRLEAAGDLPRAMVVRRKRRPRGEAEG
jgi:hypothetical protein